MKKQSDPRIMHESGRSCEELPVNMRNSRKVILNKVEKVLVINHCW